MNDTELDLLTKLRKRQRGCVVFPQVGLNGRRIDALTFGIWHSRGFLIEAFEFKASRADYLKEVRDPSKADACARYADRFWIVAANKDVVGGPVALPEAWGLLIREGSRLVARKRPQKLNPVAIDRPFVAALLKRLMNLDDDQRHAEFRRGYMEGGAQARKNVQAEAARLDAQTETRLRELDRFEQETGLSIAGWHGAGERLAADVKRARTLVEIEDRVGRQMGNVKRVLEEWRAL